MKSNLQTSAVTFTALLLCAVTTLADQSKSAPLHSQQRESCSTRLDQWRDAVTQEVGNRQIKLPTRLKQFFEIRTLKESQLIIGEARESPELQKELLRRIGLRCLRFEPKEQYAENYYAFLKCEVRGISVSALLELCGSQEQELDHVIFALFADGETDRSKWIRGFREAKRLPAFNACSDDPFQFRPSQQ
jgi:hypothetical protein